MTKMCFPPTRAVLLVWGLVASFVCAPLAQAQSSIDQRAVDRAHNFFSTADRGKAVLGFVHFGAAYKGHGYRQEDNGQVTALNQPGHFALVYRFKWEDDGVTEIAMDCDAKGNFYQVRVVRSNAVFQQPFALANASINILGNLILEAFREKMSPEEIRQVRGFIDNPNARALLEINLKLQQALGR